MNFVNKNRSLFLFGLLIALMAVPTMISCSENDPQSANLGDSVIGDLTEGLGKCTDSREGKVEFYEADSSFYKCHNGKWLLTEMPESSSSVQETLKSCSSVYDSSISSSGVGPSKVQTISKKISGVSQKGPFLTGTTVTLYEMDSSSFEQTKNSFFVKLENDKGEFEINAKDLSSQYVTIIADGFFNNEVSGKKSLSRIQLYAISDLTNRNTINVNVLTHMEYERILFLVKKQGKSFEEAKVQAEKEVLSIFDIEAATELSAEDLSIGGTTQDDAALLAVSVLTLGTDMESSFSERISKIAFDIREDGVLNDEQIKMDIADGIALYDLTSVRENIMNWKLFTSVADFETIVEGYWTKAYEIGLCSAERDAEIVENKNELSRNNGQFYVCENEKWRSAAAVEQLLGSCSNKNLNAVSVMEKGVDGELRTPMQCKSSGWEKIDVKLYDELTIDCENDGEVKVGEVSGKLYVCKGGKIDAPTLNDLVITEGYSGNLWDGSDNLWMGPYEGYWGDWYTPIPSNDRGFKSKFFNENGKVVEIISEKAISQENGIRLTYELDSSVADPWISLGPGREYEQIDVSEWEGICLAYASSTPFSLTLHSANDSEYVNDVFAVIPASIALTVIDVPWKAFHRPDWAGDKENVMEVVQFFQGFALEFRRSFGSNESGVFFIGAMGKQFGCSIKK